MSHLLVLCIQLLAEYFHGAPECVEEWVPDSWCLLLGPIPFCWLSLSNFDTIVFASSYYFVFCHVQLLSLGSLSFSNERQKRSGPEWEGHGGEQRGVEGGETV